MITTYASFSRDSNIPFEKIYCPVCSFDWVRVETLENEIKGSPSSRCITYVGPVLPQLFALFCEANSADSSHSNKKI